MMTAAIFFYLEPTTEIKWYRRVEFSNLKYSLGYQKEKNKGWNPKNK